jgi:hypothetical protein
MTGEPKNGSQPPSEAPDLQAGGAAEGWSTHSGHLDATDFSAETPAADQGAPPVGARPTAPPWASMPPGTYPPTGLPGTAPPQPGRSAMLPWVVIAALLVLVLILVGALNLRDYHLIQRDQMVEVRRGGWLPGTTRAIAAEDGVLSRRYAPLKLEPGMRFRSRRFTEREDLDAGLISLAVELLAPALNRSDDGRVELLGARLELFPSAAVVLEGRHKDLLGKVGLVRGRLAEADAISAVLRARDLYRRYRRHAGPEVSRALTRLETVQGLLSDGKSLPVPTKVISDPAKVGSEF